MQIQGQNAYHQQIEIKIDLLDYKIVLFEDIISQLFDEIVDWVARLEREMPFLLEMMEIYNVENILDVGCSTGNHAISLARKGFDVTGIDYSSFAIKKARENLSQAYLPMGVSVKFYQDDFSVFSHLSQEKFDAILILGNTLSLASDRDSIKDVMNNIHSLLADNGVVLIQVLNFENNEDNTRFSKLKEVRWEGDDCIVQRGYFVHRGYGTFLFNVLRQQEGKWDYWLKENTKIYPFTKNRFDKIINNTGFKVKKMYADFDKTSFKEESNDIIAILEKK